ncbi:hypothetical protein N9954_08020 [Maribacter sp.]|nr:hypothetical protein [Maribacter sp.]
MKHLRFIISISILALIGCAESKDSRQLDSDEFETKEERIAALKNEIIFQSDFDNAEFELFNVNGFSNSRASLPGASSWDYKFAIKVNPADIDNWTKGMSKGKPTDYNFVWTKEIVKERAPEWTTNSQPEFYTRKGDNVTMLIYRFEGILFKRIITN